MNSTNSFIINFFNSLWNVQSMSESVEQAVDFDLHEPYYSQKIWKIKHDQRPKGRKFKNMCQIYEVNFCIHEGKNYTFFCMNANESPLSPWTVQHYNLWCKFSCLLNFFFDEGIIKIVSFLLLVTQRFFILGFYLL